MKFTGLGGQAGDYPLLYNAQEIHGFFPTRYDYLTFTVVGGYGQISTSGTVSRKAGNAGLKEAFEAWRDAKDVATITDLVTNDTYTVKLKAFEVTGLGETQEWRLMCTEHR